jgi:hypothetical protein
MCGAAYKEAGLLWAARSHMLSALSFSLNAFHQTGVMHYTALLGVMQLTWIELQLGRVPHILFCLKLARYIAAHAMLDDERKARFLDFQQSLDPILSILLLKANLAQLEKLRNLPYLLEQDELYCSEGTLLFALGNINKLREDKLFLEDDSNEDIENFFTVLSSQPASDQMPAIPEFFTDSSTQLAGNILGCKIIFEAEPNPISILVAETLLAAIESFFATSLRDGAAYIL